MDIGVFMLERQKPEKRTATLIVLILFAAHMSLYACSQSIAAIAPLLQAELILSKTQIGMIVSCFYIGATVSSLPSGSLVDTMGVRKILMYGQLLASISLALFSLSTNYYLLLLFFLICGLGYGTINPASTKGIIEWFAVRQRGWAMGFKQTGNATGGALAGAILPVLAVSMGWGWRGALFSLSVFLLVMGLVAYLTYKDKKKEDNPQKKIKWTRNYREVLQNRNVIFVSILSFFMGAAHYALVTYIVIFFTKHVMIDIVLAGKFLTLIMVGGMIGRIGWGVFSDLVFHSKRKPVLALISLCCALGYFAITLLGVNTPFYIIAVIALFLGACATGWTTIMLIWLGELTEKHIVGTATGFNVTFVFLGSIIGTPLFGAIADMTGSFVVAYRSYALVLAFVALSFALMKIKPDDAKIKQEESLQLK
jgi:sugar phosphate permease